MPLSYGDSSPSLIQSTSTITLPEDSMNVITSEEWIKCSVYKSSTAMMECVNLSIS